MALKAQAGNASKFFCGVVLFSLSLLLQSGSAVSEPQSQEAARKTVFVGLGLSKPPYVIQSENRGLEYDIIKEAFASMGYAMEPRYLPLPRVSHELVNGLLDAGMNLSPSDHDSLSFSKEIIVYKNYAISLKNKNLKINTIEALGNHSIVAFQDAYKLLGDLYKASTQQSPTYFEVPNQSSQVKMLLSERVDVAISDYRIFGYYQNRLEEETGQKIEVTYHDIFEPTAYALGFRDPDLRDLFNEGFANLQRDGLLLEIYKSYALLP